MKTNKQKAYEQHLADPYHQLAEKLVAEMELFSFNVLDYSGCYYEGDTPSIDTDYIRDELEKALRAQGILNR